MAPITDVKQREKYGYPGSGPEHGKFPIKDAASAESAIDKRGFIHDDALYNWVMRTAAKYAPQAVADAKREDKKS